MSAMAKKLPSIPFRSIYMQIRKGFIVILLIICLSLGFFAGAALKMDSVFETGYKYAYMEMANLLKEGSEGRSNFYVSGLPFKFKPQADRKAIQFNFAGVGDEGIRRVHESQ